MHDARITQLLGAIAQDGAPFGMFDNSLVIFEPGQNSVQNRRGGRSGPTTVNSSVRTREYLMQGDEIRALRRLQREQGPSSHVFMTERDGPMTPKAFHALFGRIGVWAKMPFPVHPHMLRHGCGYAWLMPATTPVRCRLGSATKTSSTRCATPSCRRTGWGRHPDSGAIVGGRAAPPRRT